MTFLAYLASSTDRAAQMLAADLSGLADGANDLGEVVAHLRAAMPPCELPYASEEARYRWREWRRTDKDSLTVGVSRESSP